MHNTLFSVLIPPAEEYASLLYSVRPPDSYRLNRRTRASKSHAYNTCCSCSNSLSLWEAVISEHLNLWKDPVLTDRAQKGLGNSVTLFLNETPLSLGFEMLAVEQFDLS